MQNADIAITLTGKTKTSKTKKKARKQLAQVDTRHFSVGEPLEKITKGNLPIATVIGM